MTTLVLERYCYSETETEGRLRLNDGTTLYTIERPWRPGAKGGLPFDSCVPDGEYELLPHVRPNSGAQVFALRNTDLGVFYEADDRPDGEGRYLILIHAGNYVEDVVGCIAPGFTRAIADNRRMVTNSRKAMQKVMDGGYSQIVIRPSLGAVNA